MATKQNLPDEEDRTLTEFGPVPESPENTFSWSNFFKWNKTVRPQSPMNKRRSSSVGSKSFHYNSKRGNVVEVEHNIKTEELQSDSKNATKVEADVYTKRFSNVIRKISNALERTTNTSTYSDNDLKQYWMPDSDCKECYDCGDRFTTFRRRHHCRICGQVFCSSCCNQEIPGKLIGCRVDLRVCVYCCKVVLSCLQSTDWTADSLIDFKLLQDQLLTRLRTADDQSTSSAGLSRPQKNGVGFSEQGAAHSLSQSSNFQDFRHYDVTADEKRSSINDESVFTTECTHILENGSCSNCKDITADRDCDTSEPAWVSRINQNYSSIHKGSESLWDSVDDSSGTESRSRTSQLQNESNSVESSECQVNEYDGQNLKFKDYEVEQQYVSKDDAIRAGTFNASAVAAAEVNNLTLAQKTGEPDSDKTEITKNLNAIYEKYERRVIHQLLERHSLPFSWTDIILPMVQQIVKNVKLNSDHNRGEMDIRPSVQIKKIPGGLKSDCTIINGVVCTKNVAHKKMKSTFSSPAILLIKSPIIYQRQENKFLSLEPALLQETSYLKNVVAKIIGLKPDVVLVENTVSRLAQNFFLSADITLVLNVKSSVMNRIARLTNATVTTSIDAHFTKPQLGTCKLMCLTSYQLPNGSCKTLMKFDGCEPHLGCTVLLRGASNSDLCKVKRIMKFMIFMNFSQKLETSFLSDEMALPPPNDQSCVAIDEECQTRRTVADITLQTEDSTNESLKSESDELNVEHRSEHSDHSKTTKQRKFRTISEALKTILLNISPSVYVESPFFENSDLNKFFPDLVFYSLYLDTCDDYSSSHIENGNFNEFQFNYPLHLSGRCSLRNNHPFISAQFSNAISHVNIQMLLANFRAKGRSFYDHIDFPLERNNHDDTMTTKTETLVASSYSSDYDEHMKLDILDSFNHQSLSVLFCSYSYQSINSPYFCIDPWIVRMEFYGSNDIPLGGFLEKYCFRVSYTCPSSTCDAQMINHVRRFVHSDGCIYILLHQMDAPLSTCGLDTILVWSWCRKCKVSSKITVLSPASRALSFAKYLDLRFHNSSYVEGSQMQCSHSLHHDHYQYFACRDIIAAFKYSSITLHEVHLPTATLHKYANVSKTEESLVDEIKTLAISGHGIFDSVLDKLHDISSEPLGGKSDLFADRIQQLQHERSSFREQIKEIQIKLTSSAAGAKALQKTESSKVVDSIVNLKRHLAETVVTWNMRLNECIQLKKKEERASKQPTAVAKQAVVAPHVEPEPESLANQSSTIKVDVILKNVNTSVDTAEDIPHILEEPCMDYYCDVIPSLETADDGEQSSNHSVEMQDGNRTQDPSSLAPEKELGLDTPKTEKKSTMLVKSMISQLLSLPSAITIQMPFSPYEHHLLPHCEKVPLVVYENEPSSVIAYALCSADYELGIQEIKQISEISSKSATSKDSKESSLTIKSKLNRSLDINEEMNREAANENVETVIKDDEYINPHLEVQFADNSSKFYCRVYFAKQFLKLREVVLPEGEEQFIRCLSRCSEWQANGGKSGCVFCKTHDDRFILKQMTRLEVQSFLEFAPHYIEYMLQASSKQKPAVLVKILGAFQIALRQINHSNATSKMDFLVMENLFYGHEINKTFDLKGSVRNRLVNINGKDGTDVVLQDENLLKMACDYPLYVRQHSKMIISFAIQNDTKFLSEHSIMDYSLLVGVDEKKKELIVGIIDYIRTFTWDKKLENLVKSSGILGGQGRTPTVISPELYRNRFCEAMDRYILLVPDQWSELGSMIL